LADGLVEVRGLLSFRRVVFGFPGVPFPWPLELLAARE
jgi:hypothetical protein